MILNMQGRMQESQAIIAKTGEADQMAAMNAALDPFRRSALAAADRRTGT
jgi:hypothetical protein